MSVFGKANQFEITGQISAGPMQLGIDPTIQSMPSQTPDLAPSQPQPIISGPGI